MSKEIKCNNNLEYLFLSAVEKLNIKFEMKLKDKKLKKSNPTDCHILKPINNLDYFDSIVLNWFIYILEDLKIKNKIVLRKGGFISYEFIDFENTEEKYAKLRIIVDYYTC